ncbi:SIR2 family protein [Yersinia pestis]|nr:SIR2 family protein [Yersinia pestis]
MKEELEILKKLKDKMLTVITTNYDTFLEDHIFINHEKIIKQKIFTGSELGTLMKIHGCVSEPNSLILTEFDYENYYKKSKVLAAKVINLFAENPVFFFGYSITDENIRDFLQDVYTCLETPQEFNTFEKRLVIIEYNPTASSPIVGPHTLDINGIRINLTKIVLSDFTPVYEEMSKLKNFTQLKEIQRLKTLVYEIVHDYHGEKKRIVNLMEESEDEDDGVVVVIGKESRMMDAIGITGIRSEQLFRDLVFDDFVSLIPVNVLVEVGLPNLLKGSGVLPVNKYLSLINRSKVLLDERVIAAEAKEPEDLLTNSILKDMNAYLESNYHSLEEIYLSEIPNYKKLHFIIFQAMYRSECEELHDFLRTRYDELLGYWNGTILRKLVCILDIRKYKRGTQQG